MSHSKKEESAAAEDFQPLTGDDSVLDRQFITPTKTFLGKKLFPYSRGMQLLTAPVAAGVPGSNHWLLIVFFLLLDTQEHYERFKATLSEDDATDEAIAAILREISDEKRVEYQAKTIRRAGKLGKKGIEEAIKIMLEIHEESKESELVPAEEGEQSPGK